MADNGKSSLVSDAIYHQINTLLQLERKGTGQLVEPEKK